MERPEIARVVSVLSSMTGAPNGDASHVFEMFVHLAAGAQLNVKCASRERHRARRSVKGMPIWTGVLLSEGDSWVLQSNDDDDPIWFISFGALRPGEYMTLYPPDGRPLVFRIVKVDYPADADCLCRA